MIRPKIFIAGSKGMVGSALIRLLKDQEVEILIKDRTELDLMNQDSVQNFFKNEKIDQIYLAAAKVGGIYANSTYPADFIYQNLMIQNNVIHSAFLSGVKKLLFLGSSCIYPKNANQPMKEEELLSDKLEPTNEPYAVAKIAGIKMCESYNRQYGVSDEIDYRSVMPTNLYGPGDNYHPENSHVIPGLIYRFHKAKVDNLSEVTIWGTGTPKREFLHVNDLASACIHVMYVNKNLYCKNIGSMITHVNVGSGKEITIKNLAELIKHIVGYKGKIKFDPRKPDGTLSKLMNNNRIRKLNWKNKINLEDGLSEVYSDFKKNLAPLE